MSLAQSMLRAWSSHDKCARSSPNLFPRHMGQMRTGSRFLCGLSGEFSDAIKGHPAVDGLPAVPALSVRIEGAC